MGWPAREVADDGQVHASRRVDCLRRHFAQILLAIEDGFDVRDYFA